MITELTQLAEAYFHQDYDLEADEPLGVVRMFIRDSQPVAIKQFAAELDSVLASYRDDAALRHLWLETLRASYDPLRDGLTYRQWFEEMRRAVD